MRVGKFLHKLLDKAIHKKQVSVLSEVVESALDTKSLSLTHLGRGIKNKRQERSNIRKVDRLFGNQKILNKRIKICHRIISWLLNNVHRPLIIVDTVKLPGAELYGLRASCTIGGRCHTLYELIYSKKKEGHPKLHKKFLNDLSLIIPKECKPIIVTDAGFHNPWFKSVLALGWDYLGRIRGRKIYRMQNDTSYFPCSKLWGQAKGKAQYIGTVILSKKNPLHCAFILYKRTLRGRISPKNRDYDMYSRSYREPWLLATSLSDFKPYEIVNMYRRRMNIEESFRDMKSGRYGLGLESVTVLNKARYGLILLIAMLANFIACSFGHIMELKNLHYQFQANSIKTRRVLSFFYLGCLAIKKQLQITYEDIIYANSMAKLQFAASF